MVGISAVVCGDASISTGLLGQCGGWLVRRAGSSCHFPARLHFPLKNVTAVTDSCAKARDGGWLER
jgi:hypothetical protein